MTIKMDIKNKKVTVVGLGKSGIAAANLLVKKGAVVSVTEAGSSPQIKTIGEQLSKKGIEVEIGGHTEGFVAGKDLVVTSPGVPSKASPLVWAEEEGISIISEIELGFNFCHHPIIAVTGTNGKTTVTTLIGEIFRQAGRETVVCGNIGNPFSGEMERLNPPLLNPPPRGGRKEVGAVVVLEVSSFQLEKIDSFRPALSIILNITPDHLDRYAGLKEYREAKFRIFENQTRQDWLILNFDDPLLRNLKGQTNPKQLFFSAGENPPSPPFVKGGNRRIKGAGYLKDEKLILEFDDKPSEICTTDEVKLKGEHNLGNLLAASLAARAFGVSEEIIARTLRGFSGLEHRFEEVAKIDGVTFINDSKATNVEAAMEALRACEGKVILIAGGQDKGLDYGAARKEIKERVRIMILIGEAKERIKAGLKGATEIIEAEDLIGAVRMACGFARSGETVLLSPMCASFDAFSSYAERGKVFKKAVESLIAN